MKGMKLTGLLTLGVAVLATTSVRADFINGSFETGNISGWTNNPFPAGATTQVVLQHVAVPPSIPVGFTFRPTNGNFFALLKTDGPGNVNRLFQDVVIQDGNRIEFDIFFDSGDPGPFPANNDVGRAFLSQGGVQIGADLFNATSQSVGAVGHTPWTTIQTGPLAAGTYRLNVEVANTGTAQFDSFVGLDRVSVVPEPASLTMVAIGAIGLAGYRWRRQKRQS